MRLFESIESPVLTDIKLSFSGVEMAEVYPQRVPDLFMHQPLMVYGRITKGRIGRLHITARNGNQPYETTIAFDASKTTFHPGITTLWARQRVEDLMDHWRNADIKGQEEIRGSVIAHATRYHLVTRFTSLVAVEEVIANPSGQSKTAAVPNELPEGMKMDKVFGAPATGTADSFLEALGAMLLAVGVGLFYIGRRANAGAIS